MPFSWTFRLIFVRLVVDKLARDQGIRNLGELVARLTRDRDALAGDSADVRIAHEAIGRYRRQARKGGAAAQPEASVLATLQHHGIVDPTLGIDSVVGLLTGFIKESRPQRLEGGVECS